MGERRSAGTARNFPQWLFCGRAAAYGVMRHTGGGRPGRVGRRTWEAVLHTGNKGDFTGCMKNCKGRPGRSRRAGRGGRDRLRYPDEIAPHGFDFETRRRRHRRPSRIGPDDRPAGPDRRSSNQQYHL